MHNQDNLLLQYMRVPKYIRNVCIVAHVDHGKTTIADSLLATNRLVSKRLAGQLRYLDDRPDEQQRGITMKTSAVSLLNEVAGSPQILNIIDTPGHIDFSCEVGAALRLSDGALIVVDLVEGVCAQTREAIKLALQEHCAMILVLNKIDKLIVDLRKDVNAIFFSILHAIESCNAIIAQLYSCEQKEESHLLFTPNIGNVIFCSAIDGWGITIKQCVQTFSAHFPNIGLNELYDAMWNFDMFIKGGVLKQGAIDAGKHNVFIQLCIQTIVHIYTTIIINMDRAKIEDVAKKLGIATITREMKHTNTRIQLRALMQAWCPLAQTILLQCHEIIPPPCNLTKDHINHLLDYGSCTEDEDKISSICNLLQQCRFDSGVCIVYVSKMFCVERKQVRMIASNEDSENYVMIALARVYSGTLDTSTSLYILSGSEQVPTKAKCEKLFTLIGRDLICVEYVPAGNVCGISGLDLHVTRTATMSSKENFLIRLVDAPSSLPVVRNAIEPQNPTELPILRTGLKRLMQSDPCVQIMVQPNGEHVLLTAGDVHLEKCLEDLTTKFAKIKINVSNPMVSLRETILSGDRKERDFECSSVKLRILAQPIESDLYGLLETNLKIFKSFFECDGKITDSHRKQVQNIFKQFAHINIWAFREYQGSINILVNDTNDYKRNAFIDLPEQDKRFALDQYIINAFKSICNAGPICDEPLQGVSFHIKHFSLLSNENDYAKNPAISIKDGASVQLSISTSFKEAFQLQPQRIMEPMFTTDIQVNTSILGKVYTVISRRHGRVLEAVGMDEQEKSFMVQAQIPVVTSNGFANEIRKTTSGQGIPNLKFSHYEIIDGDPLHAVLADEELNGNNESEDSSDFVEKSLRAAKLRRDVRKRKGLYIEEQVTLHAEKQRTLNKKK